MSDVSNEEIRALLKSLGHKADKLMPIVVMMTKNQTEALALLAIVAGYLTTHDLGQGGATETSKQRREMFIEFYNMLCSANEAVEAAN